MTDDEMMPIIHAFEARRGFTLNTAEMFAFIAGYETALADTNAKREGIAQMAPLALAEALEEFDRQVRDTIDTNERGLNANSQCREIGALVTLRPHLFSDCAKALREVA